MKGPSDVADPTPPSMGQRPRWVYWASGSEGDE